MTKKSMTRVMVNDFNVADLLKAAQEGRLYVEAVAQTDNHQTREKGIDEILSYVSRIDKCAAAEFRPNIRMLWTTILRSKELGHLFFLSRYAVSRGKPNLYRVTAVVTSLLEMGVYRQADFLLVDLHLLMEQTSRRNSFYTGMGRYLLEHDQLNALREIVAKFRRMK